VSYRENPELENDMVESLFRRWRKGRFLLARPQRDIYEAIASRVEGKSVCDVGSGSGLGTVILAQKARSVVGLEKLASSTEFSQKCFPLNNIRFVNQDITTCSLQERSFDVVTAIEIIEHVAAYQAALIQMWRILKPGGTLYISSPNRNNPHIPNDRPGNKHHVREWTAGEFYDILSGYFRAIELRDFTLTRPQERETQITPLIAVCKR